jgi:outer membrane scaffolding protein for murein synthesis (MipA/OmpV family)
MHRTLLAAALGTALSVTAAPPVQAAEPASSGSTFTAGFGVAVLPKYFGADELRALPVLDLSYASSNGFFASTQKGVGFRSAAGPLQLSAALGYSAGRRERDSHRRFGSDALRGMGDIRGGAVANLGVGYDAGFMTLGMEAELALNHRERGNRLEFALGVPLFVDESDNVALFAAFNVADRKNMQAFYGVTQQQSARAGYRVYTPDAGVEKVGVGVSWNHQLSQNWSVRTMAGAFTLVGDAADSPLTRRKSAPVLFTTLNYRF